VDIPPRSGGIGRTLMRKLAGVAALAAITFASVLFAPVFLRQLATVACRDTGECDIPS
jgi:hypothetical protein